MTTLSPVVTSQLAAIASLGESGQSLAAALHTAYLVHGGELSIRPEDIYSGPIASATAKAYESYQGKIQRSLVPAFEIPYQPNSKKAPQPHAVHLFGHQVSPSLYASKQPDGSLSAASASRIAYSTSIPETSIALLKQGPESVRARFDALRTQREQIEYDLFDRLRIVRVFEALNQVTDPIAKAALDIQFFANGAEALEPAVLSLQQFKAEHHNLIDTLFQQQVEGIENLIVDAALKIQEIAKAELKLIEDVVSYLLQFSEDLTQSDFNDLMTQIIETDQFNETRKHLFNTRMIQSCRELKDHLPSRSKSIDRIVANLRIRVADIQAEEVGISIYDALASGSEKLITWEFTRLREAKNELIFSQFRDEVDASLETFASLKPENFDELSAEFAKLKLEIAEYHKEKAPYRGLIKEAKKNKDTAEIARLTDEQEAIFSKIHVVTEQLNKIKEELNLGEGVQTFLAHLTQAIQDIDTTFINLSSLEDSLVSHVVQEAVDVSGDDLKQYYILIATAAEGFEKAAQIGQDTLAFFSAAKDRIDSELNNPATNSGQRIKRIDALLSDIIDAAKRQLDRANKMSLPEEQAGLGQFYNVADELAKLGLGHLSNILPDRIPIPARADHAPDAHFLNGGNEIDRFFDLSLRAALTVPAGQEIRDADEAVILLTHGAGTEKSTLGSILMWQSLLLKNYGQDNKKSSKRSITDRNAAVFGISLPGHGYGTKDKRFFDAEDSGVHSLLEKLHNPDIVVDYLSAFQERYSQYRDQGKPVIFGGRSVGGFLARLHRLKTKGTSSAFDGYISLSAYPFNSFYWNAYSGALLSRVSSTPKKWDMLDWFIRLANSHEAIDRTVTDTTSPLLNKAGGLDIDYPADILADINPDSETYKTWKESVVERLVNNFSEINPEQTNIIIDDFFAWLREDVLPHMTDKEISAEEYWKQLMKGEVGGLMDFWKEDDQGDDQATLLYQPDAVHNSLSRDHNPDHVAQESLTADLRFIEKIIGLFQGKYNNQ